MQGPVSVDKFRSMTELLAALPARENYSVHVDQSHRSSIKIFAPHGGCIEPCTEPVALSIALERYDCFVFSGRRSHGCFATLHVTSVHYDEPQCLALAAEAEIGVAIHGCEGAESIVYVGGGNPALAADLIAHLVAGGFPARPAPARMAGGDDRNFVNRARRKGVQIEMSAGFRKALFPSFPRTLQRDPVYLPRFIATMQAWLVRAEQSLASPMPS
jgi:phage replication-related protein YjqB (UPF0714/DUF867 family)